MTTGERSPLSAGEKSRDGDESRDDGLDERERGDMGLANGDPQCCSASKGDAIGGDLQETNVTSYSNDPEIL